MPRMSLTDAGPAQVAGDFALGGSWGTSPSIGTPEAGSNDSAGRVVITSGSGSPGAAPTVTLTLRLPDRVGLKATRPKVVCNYPFVVTSKTVVASGGDNEQTTAIVFTFQGTPIASTAYALEYHLFT